MIKDENLRYIFSTEAIRDKAESILQLTLEGQTQFHLFPEKLEEVADYVLKVMKEKYPDNNIPFHSRWGHFNVGDINRLQELEKVLEGKDSKEKSKIKVDLAIISVLLDAGAGTKWSYSEKESGKEWNRSEGLAVMSFWAFMEGTFSSVENDPLRVDSEALKKINLKDIENFMQVSESNPLEGLEGRLSLLNKLGEVLERKLDFFPEKRPGSLVSFMEKN